MAVAAAMTASMTKIAFLNIFSDGLGFRFDFMVGRERQIVERITRGFVIALKLIARE